MHQIMRRTGHEGMLSQRDVSNYCIPAHEGELHIKMRQALRCAKRKDERQFSSWKLQLTMKKKSQLQWSSTASGCPERLCNLWKYSKHDGKSTEQAKPAF